MLQNLKQSILKKIASKYVPSGTFDGISPLLTKSVQSGFRVTVGYFNEDDIAPQQLIEQYLLIAKYLSNLKCSDKYISVKAPSFGYDFGCICPLIEFCKNKSILVHFDSHSLSSAQPTIDLISKIKNEYPNVLLGMTIPSRWQRSILDIEWAIENCIKIRLVKGQWSDDTSSHSTSAPHKDELVDIKYKKCLDTISNSNSSAAVRIATHNSALVEYAIATIPIKKLEIELLQGLPCKKIIRVCQAKGVSIGKYIPYGEAWIPYALGQLKKQPGKVIWIVRDLLNMD